MKEYLNAYKDKPLLFSQSLFWLSKSLKILSYKVRCIDHSLWKSSSFIAYWSLNLLRLLFISPELRICRGPDEFESFEEKYHELKEKTGPSAWLK